jgi:hypothetical protein
MRRDVDRTRRYRARQRHGIAILRVPVPLFDLSQALIEAERLTPAQALERREVERSAAEVLAEWSRRWAQKL